MAQVLKLFAPVCVCCTDSSDRNFSSAGDSPVRVFGTIKGGFLRFSVDNRPVTGGTILSTIKLPLADGNVNGVLYPGGGIEFFLGWLGVRADIGDEIYFDNGAHNNLRVTFGPHVRF